MVIGVGVGVDLGWFVSGVVGGLSVGVVSILVCGGSLGYNIGVIVVDVVVSIVGNMVLEEMVNWLILSVSLLYGLGSDVNVMMVNVVCVYGGDFG